MAGVETHTQRTNLLARGCDPLQLGLNGRTFDIASGRVEGMRVRTGMNLADLNAHASSSSDLIGLCINKGAGDDTGITQFGHDVGETRLLADDIQSTFGRDFLTPFWHEHGHFRPEFAGNGDHFIGCGHFQVELDLSQVSQFAHIGVLNMTAVFAQVNCNAIGTANVRLHGSPDRVRFIGTARLAQCGYVVDVYAKFNHRRHSITVKVLPDLQIDGDYAAADHSDKNPSGCA